MSARTPGTFLTSTASLLPGWGDRSCTGGSSAGGARKQRAPARRALHPTQPSSSSSARRSARTLAAAVRSSSELVSASFSCPSAEWISVGDSESRLSQSSPASVSLSRAKSVAVAGSSDASRLVRAQYRPSRKPRKRGFLFGSRVLLPRDVVLTSPRCWNRAFCLMSSVQGRGDQLAQREVNSNPTRRINRFSDLAALQLRSARVGSASSPDG